MKKSIEAAALFVVILMVGSALGAPIKERVWQEGKLLDIVKTQQGSIWAGGWERITYIIDADKYVYTASHVHSRRDTAMLVTVNATIKFAVEKSKVYILDEEGKEHDLKFEKKTLKETAKEKG